MRKKKNYKREFNPDVKYDSVALTRFTNYIMKNGRKYAAEKVVYRAMDIIKEKLKLEPLVVFEKALENAAPTVAVVSRRVGGANYQIPEEVRPDRKFVLAARWIIAAARSKDLENAAPTVAVVSRRVGGANYQIPEEVRPDRKFVLAARWIIAAARS